MAHSGRDRFSPSLHAGYENFRVTQMPGAPAGFPGEIVSLYTNFLRSHPGRTTGSPTRSKGERHGQRNRDHQPDPGPKHNIEAMRKEYYERIDKHEMTPLWKVMAAS